jgi:hypothetical protein
VPAPADFEVSCIPGGVAIPGSTGPTTVYFIVDRTGDIVDATEFYTREEAQAFLDAHRLALKRAWSVPLREDLARAEELLSMVDAKTVARSLNAEQYAGALSILERWLQRYEYPPELHARLIRAQELIQDLLKR